MLSYPFWIQIDDTNCSFFYGVWIVEGVHLWCQISRYYHYQVFYTGILLRGFRSHSCIYYVSNSSHLKQLHIFYFLNYLVSSLVLFFVFVTYFLLLLDGAPQWYIDPRIYVLLFESLRLLFQYKLKIYRLGLSMKLVPPLPPPQAYSMC